MASILNTTDLTKIYGKKTAVNNVQMNINKGEIYGFIGRNGAGKTTLIKMILGLAEPTTGKIELFGEKNLEKGRRKIGSVIEAPAFVPHLSAKENMYIQWQLLGSKDKKIIDETLKLVGLENTGKLKAKKFSLGMKQRLGIAMSLMGEPEFLVLDEPTNGLDPEGIREIRELLKKLTEERGLTILISSHILGELSKLATRYGIINEGKLIEEFSAQELEEKSGNMLLMNVSNSQKAAKVLEEQLGTKNFKIVDEHNIELGDFVDQAGVVNSTLSKNEIEVNSISAKKADLEEYFFSLIGGKKNA